MHHTIITWNLSLSSNLKSRSFSSYLQLAGFKTPMTFHHTDWLIGILTMAFYNLYTIGYSSKVPHIQRPIKIAFLGQGLGSQRSFFWVRPGEVTMKCTQVYRFADVLYWSLHESYLVDWTFCAANIQHYYIPAGLYFFLRWSPEN